MTNNLILKAIKNRFFRGGDVRHFGDCDIYNTDKIFCSCGLLYDLNSLANEELANILYPKFDRDYKLQTCDFDIDKMTEEEKIENNKKNKEIEDILKDVFKEYNLRPLTEDEKLDNWNGLIREVHSVFGSEFPLAIERIEKLKYQ